MDAVHFQPKLFWKTRFFFLFSRVIFGDNKNRWTGEISSFSSKKIKIKKKMKREIFDAIDNGNSRKLENLLNEKSEKDFLETVLIRNDQLRTPLHVCVRKSRIECGSTILRWMKRKEEAKLSRKFKSLKREMIELERDAEDDTKKMKALKRRRKKLRRSSCLAKEKYFVSLLKAKDKRGRTPLHFAASHMGFPLHILLDGVNGANLQSNADLNVLTKDDILQLQETRREILDMRDTNGRTALHFASFNGTISLLLLSCFS